MGTLKMKGLSNIFSEIKHCRDSNLHDNIFSTSELQNELKSFKENDRVNSNQVAAAAVVNHN